MDIFSTFPRAEIATRLRDLASKGVFLGTSSWKYPGWSGLLYDEQRYLYRGKLAKSRFERECLSEYAETFSSVCVDAGYYQFPTAKQIAGLCAQVPSHFKFSYKVTEEITVKRFPHLPRYGNRKGVMNPNFLNPEAFKLNFLRPMEKHRDNIGLLIFEFSRLKPDLFPTGRAFVEEIDRFLGALPKEWQYGVEIRNKSLLHPDYFASLASHGVTLVFNSWEKMPGLEEQLALPESRTAPFAGARLLLKPGRKYSQAVDAFAPYNRTQEELPDVRKAAADLIRELLLENGDKPSKQASFLYVNNRLEGNSLFTIKGILDQL